MKNRSQSKRKPIRRGDKDTEKLKIHEYRYIKA